MTFRETLKSQCRGLTNYLCAPVTPTLTTLIAGGVRRPLTMLLQTLLRTVSTSPPRLLICLTLIALSLLGALIIWT